MTIINFKGDVPKINGAQYQFKDGQIGTVTWDGGKSIFGTFTSKNGARFTVSDGEVTLVKSK